MEHDECCPACGGQVLSVCYEQTELPAHSVLLMPTREQALGYPRGQLRLVVCRSCGFMSNLCFDSRLNAYAQGYEATQSFSETFNTFHQQLARHLIERYALHGKTVIEIGCGQGEFLALLTSLGDIVGLGFDPAYDPEHCPLPKDKRVTVIKDYYSERYSDYAADLICCKMTLEHIQPVHAFVSGVREAIGMHDSVVFFQVPNMLTILDQLAFWDIYYEHCSYFSPGALARLFRSCGFEVLDLWQAYNNQYVMIEARPSYRPVLNRLPLEEHPAQFIRTAERFAELIRRRLNGWRHLLGDLAHRGQRVVLWGGGSKAVAFLTTLQVGNLISYAVDINPRKRGYYLPGSGQEVVGPDFLCHYRPDAVIVMNPIYTDEIRRTLAMLELDPQLIAVST